MTSLLNDESGFVVSAELVIIATVAVLALVVGLSEVAVAVNTELCDIHCAIGSLDQSFKFAGFSATGTGGHVKSIYNGSQFNDGLDTCDCTTSCSGIVNCTVNVSNDHSNG